MNALDASKLDDFMLVVWYDAALVNKQTRCTIMTFYGHTHSVTDVQLVESCGRMIISNKQCKIDGYNYRFNLE